MSYWENAEDFVKLNPDWIELEGWFNAVGIKVRSRTCWLQLNNSFLGGVSSKPIFLRDYFRDWDNQTQKEWDMVCMLFNVPQVYVKQQEREDEYRNYY